MKTALIASIGIVGLVVGIQSATAQNRGALQASRGGPEPTTEGRSSNTPAQEINGPKQRGASCVVVNDSTRNYGYMKQCPPPQGGSPKAAAR